MKDELEEKYLTFSHPDSLARRSFIAMRLAKELFRLHELKMKGKRCTQIQRLFRGWWWRRHAYQKKASEAARRLYASR